MELQGRVALVTGAAQGIGAAYARRLAELDATTFVADIDGASAGETAGKFRADGLKAEAITVDIADPHSCEAAVATIVSRTGRIDVLVNNAAIYRGLERHPADEIPIDLWRRMIDVNISGNYYMCRSVIPHMRAQQSGKIVNQSSIATWLHSPNVMHYTLTKAAMISMTQCLATELGPAGINVNALAPGVITTPATTEAASTDLLAAMANSIKLQRLGTTDDLLGALQFLCTSASDYVTGQVLVVDGGLCMVS